MGSRREARAALLCAILAACGPTVDYPFVMPAGEHQAHAVVPEPPPLNVGTDFRALVTGNAVSAAYDFAVAVANPGERLAHVTIEGGALGSPILFTVDARDVRVQVLPWVDALRLCFSVVAADPCPAMVTGALSVGGNYRVISDVPVTVQQFNALQ